MNTMSEVNAIVYQLQSHVLHGTWPLAQEILDMFQEYCLLQFLPKDEALVCALKDEKRMLKEVPNTPEISQYTEIIDKYLNRILQ